jgi:hypothetical protein
LDNWHFSFTSFGDLSVFSWYEINPNNHRITMYSNLNKFHGIIQSIYTINGTGGSTFLPFFLHTWLINWMNTCQASCLDLSFVKKILMINK